MVRFIWRSEVYTGVGPVYLAFRSLFWRSSGLSGVRSV
ncbi:hypothetical protein HNO89_001348 [Sporosarcina luteola]|nr:hypothetical protein [Sporosarcina luteola]